MQKMIDSYEDVIWEKTVNGQQIRNQVDNLIEKNLTPPDKRFDVWMFQKLKEYGPTEIFGDVVLIQPKARTTSAFSLKEGTELLSISYNSYTKVIEKAIRKDITTKTTFLKEVRIFRHMSQSQLERLLFLTKSL